MNPNLVNGIAEALLAVVWPVVDAPLDDADREWVIEEATGIAEAAVAFVAALPHDYTAADVLAEMRGDAP